MLVFDSTWFYIPIIFIVPLLILVQLAYCVYVYAGNDHIESSSKSISHSRTSILSDDKKMPDKKGPEKHEDDTVGSLDRMLSTLKAESIPETESSKTILDVEKRRGHLDFVANASALNVEPSPRVITPLKSSSSLLMPMRKKTFSYTLPKSTSGIYKGRRITSLLRLLPATNERRSWTLPSSWQQLQSKRDGVEVDYRGSRGSTLPTIRFRVDDDYGETCRATLLSRRNPLYSIRSDSRLYEQNYRTKGGLSEMALENLSRKPSRNLSALRIGSSRLSRSTQRKSSKIMPATPEENLRRKHVTMTFPDEDTNISHPDEREKSSQVGRHADEGTGKKDGLRGEYFKKMSFPNQSRTYRLLRETNEKLMVQNKVLKCSLSSLSRCCRTRGTRPSCCHSGAIGCPENYPACPESSTNSHHHYSRSAVPSITPKRHLRKRTFDCRSSPRDVHHSACQRYRCYLPFSPIHKLQRF